MRDAVRKTTRILSLLKQETDSEHCLTASSLASRLEEAGIPAERRSVYRAVRALQQQGEPIVTTRRGYYYAHAAADEDMIFALAAAVSTASFLTEERRQTLLNSLAARFEKEEASLLLSRSEPFYAAVRKDDTLFLSLAALARAIDARQQVTFFLPAESTERFRACPYALVFHRDEWQLLCALSQGDSLSCFPVERLREVRLETQPRRHFSEVSPYRTRFDALDALHRFFPVAEK